MSGRCHAHTHTKHAHLFVCSVCDAVQHLQRRRPKIEFNFIILHHFGVLICIAWRFDVVVRVPRWMKCTGHGMTRPRHGRQHHHQQTDAVMSHARSYVLKAKKRARVIYTRLRSLRFVFSISNYFKFWCICSAKPCNTINSHINWICSFSMFQLLRFFVACWMFGLIKHISE